MVCDNLHVLASDRDKVVGEGRKRGREERRREGERGEGRWREVERWWG